MKFSGLLVATLVALAVPSSASSDKMTFDLGGGIAMQSRQDNQDFTGTSSVARMAARYDFTKKFVVRASFGGGRGSGSLSNETSSPTRASKTFGVDGVYRLGCNELSLGIEYFGDVVSRQRLLTSLDLSQTLESRISSWSPVLRLTRFSKVSGKVLIESSASVRPLVFQHESSVSREDYRVNRGWASDQWAASENTRGFGASAGVVGYYLLANNVQVGVGYGVSYLSSDAGIARFRPESSSGSRTDWQHTPVVQFRFRP